MWARILTRIKNVDFLLVVLPTLCFVVMLSYFTGVPFSLKDTDPFFHLMHGLYSAMWSNIWAPSAWTLLGFVIADIRNARRHASQKLHHIDTIEGLAGQIEALSDKLVELMAGGTTDDNTLE